MRTFHWLEEIVRILSRIPINTTTNDPEQAGGRMKGSSARQVLSNNERPKKCDEVRTTLGDRPEVRSHTWEEKEREREVGGDGRGWLIACCESRLGRPLRFSGSLSTIISSMALSPRLLLRSINSPIHSQANLRLLSSSAAAAHRTPIMSSSQPAKFPDPSNWPAAKVRSTFIDFFAKDHGHTFWKSASVIPFEDRESSPALL
jgi:hypothetical protein